MYQLYWNSWAANFKEVVHNRDRRWKECKDTCAQQWDKYIPHECLKYSWVLSQCAPYVSISKYLHIMTSCVQTPESHKKLLLTLSDKFALLYCYWLVNINLLCFSDMKELFQVGLFSICLISLFFIRYISHAAWSLDCILYSWQKIRTFASSEIIGVMWCYVVFWKLLLLNAFLFFISSSI